MISLMQVQESPGRKFSIGLETAKIGILSEQYSRSVGRINEVQPV